MVERTERLKRLATLTGATFTEHPQMGSRTIYTLVKIFDELRYAHDFSSGRLYARPLEEFRAMEDGDATRGDRFEGSLLYYSDPRSLSLSLDLPNTGRLTIPGTDLAHSPQLNYYQTMWTHVYCMSAMHSGDWQEIRADRFDEFVAQTRFDDRLIALGGYAAIITNPLKFLERLDLFGVSEARSYKCGLVQYYDESSFNGSFEPGREAFMKSSRFSYQREYRFAMDFGPYDRCPSARVIEIGDISDITVIMPTSELNHQLYFNPPSTEAPTGP